MDVWHFLKVGRRTGEGDLPVVPGETQSVVGEIVPCKNGLHGSPTVYAALAYAPGLLLQRARLGGEIVPHGDPTDKYAGRARTCLWIVDVTTPVVTWALDCAERAGGSDPRSIAAIAAGRRWVAGGKPPTQVEMDAAGAAAGAAARAAGDAARAAQDAAGAAGAAWVAAWAAWDAARAAWAAWDAARAAGEAWVAAWAARDAAGAAGAARAAGAAGAARDAARDAARAAGVAWGAEEAWQGAHLGDLVAEHCRACGLSV